MKNYGIFFQYSEEKETFIMFTNTSAISNHHVLSGWIRSICQTARGYGIDPIPLMQQSGLNPDFLNVPESRYPIEGVRTFWDKLINATGDNLFGLTVGKELQAPALNSMGIAMISCSSLAELMGLMARYGKVISTTSRISLSHNARITSLVWHSVDGSEILHSARLAMMAFIYRQACSLSQHHVVPAYVTLSMPFQDNRERIDAYFGTAVTYGAETDELAFFYHDTIEPYAGANTQLVHSNEAIIDKYLGNIDKADICAQVMSHIEEMMGQKEPRITDIAPKLHLSVRTLQRRLKELSLIHI